MITPVVGIKQPNSIKLALLQKVKYKCNFYVASLANGADNLLRKKLAQIWGFLDWLLYDCVFRNQCIMCLLLHRESSVTVNAFGNISFSFEYV